MNKQPSKKPRPTIAIIGAGRLGQALAIALRSSGYQLLAMVARSRQKAEKTVALLAGDGKPEPRALAANQLSELPPTDLILIATPDDAIAGTAERLSKVWQGAGLRTALHTSGALSAEALAPLAQRDFQTGSIHPLVSISEPVSGAKALRGAFYCLEGTRKAKTMAAALVGDLGGRSFTINPESKALYHAAAVMASPHLTALFDLATEMLAACGLKPSQAQDVLTPLLASTVNNLKVSSSRKALTGTFARGDVATVRKHLQALEGNDLAEALAVYKLLGLHSLKLAEKNGLDPQLLKQIRKLLRKGEGI